MLCASPYSGPISAPEVSHSQSDNAATIATIAASAPTPYTTTLSRLCCFNAFSYGSVGMSLV